MLLRLPARATLVTPPKVVNLVIHKSNYRAEDSLVSRRKQNATATPFSDSSTTTIALWGTWPSRTLTRRVPLLSAEDSATCQ
jgi:hypothetical protein